ncbi:MULTISPECIES: ORF6C domain-containing protein [Clostridium]|uniref:ORF6C domain-containing protein n=1 Tax=Clostridium TaxID=1485 RepID=UPI0015D4C2F6|nr:MULTISPECIES: ORF6C domain-containing protein [Clostridium]MDU2155386.1 ORF6C domain-containing protein [Clostridium sp.]
MNNQIVKINNTELSVKEFNGQRVVTFKDIDMLHERVEGTAKRNFADNKKRFIENVDYFELSKNDVGTDFVLTYGFDKKAPKGLLITESGYLMLVKSLQDDLAWKVQRELVNNYFRAKQIVQAKLSKELQAIFMIDGKQQELEQEIIVVRDEVKDLKDNLPLLGVDCDEITSLIKKICTKVTGYETPAYKDKSLRGRVYSDIYGQVKREFQVKSYKAIKRSQIELAKGIITNYKAPKALLDEIIQVNNQVDFEEVI